MRLKPRRRARIAGRHRRPRPYRVVPDLAPQTWRAWEAQNGGKRWYRRLPLAIEWVLERFVHWLRGLALFDLLELAGKLTVLVAVIFWFLEADDRAKERHYRAWGLINAARGSTGDGGRRDALQDLNKDGVSLEEAPLEKAYLVGVDIKGANLVGANLQDANLRGASLGGANLQDAYLLGANLQDASLGGANLQDADLRGAKLRGADLRGADLRGAEFLTQEQLNTANGDDDTLLPEGLTRPAHWSKAEGSEDQPAAQPDAANRAPAREGAPGSDK